MSTPHPLNQAVIAQALYDLRNGQLRRCKAMGFGEAELDALKHPALISVLANASVSWCSVTVNREVLQRLLNQAQDVEKEIATVDRMLRLGASTEMVSRFYGLTHQEVALRRDILGLPKRKGRHPVLDETQDTELWRQWKAVTSSRNVDLEDETSILDAAMDLAEGMSLPLSVVWAAIRTGSIRDWLGHGRGRHRPTSPRQGPIALADLFDAALKDLAQSTPRASALAVPTPAASGDAFLFSGNRHESVPRRLFLDRRLTPLERNAWQVFRLMLNDDGVTAFPTYEQLRPWLASMPCAGRPRTRPWRGR
jgi:hypothetical protein